MTSQSQSIYDTADDEGRGGSTGARTPRRARRFVRTGGNRDWNELARAARRALADDRSASSVFRRVFEEPGFATSASGMEIGYAALGVALCGDAAGLAYFATRAMPFNGIDDQLTAARVLLAPPA